MTAVKILGIILGLLIILFGLIIFTYMFLFIFIGNFPSEHNIGESSKGDLAEAAIAMSMGRTDKAIEAYDRVIDNDPKNVTAWYSKGYAFYKWGKASKNSSNYAEAIRSFDKVIELNQSFAGAYPNRNAWALKGDALFALNRTEDALQSYKKAVELNPNDEDAWKGEGRALRALGKNHEAVAAYDKAIALDPGLNRNLTGRDQSEIRQFLWQKYRALEGMGAYERANESFMEFNKVSQTLKSGGNGS